MRFFRSICLDAAAAPGVMAPPAIPPVSPESRVNALTAQLIAQHGTIENAMRALVLNQATAEQTISALTGQLNDAKARLPKDGDVVIPKAEAAEYAKVVALGLKPDDIVAAVKERDSLKATDATRSLSDRAKDAAKAHKLDGDGFAAHATRAGLHLEARDETVTVAGKSQPVKVWYARPAAEATAPLVKVTDYIAKLPAYEQRALQAATAPATPSVPVPGVEYPATVVPVNAAPGDPLTDYLSKRNELAAKRPNGLTPRPAGSVV